MNDLPMLAQRLAELEQRQDKMAEALSTAESERDSYHALYLEMMATCRELERGLMGQASERLQRPNEAQLSFDIVSTMIGERDKAVIESFVSEHTKQVVKEHKRNKPTGRRPFPEELPRVDIEVLPDEVVQDGLNAFEKIGEEVTEIIERRPASLVVARVVKPKFVRKGRDKTKTDVLVCATPALPIERGMAGPGMPRRHHRQTLARSPAAQSPRGHLRA